MTKQSGSDDLETPPLSQRDLEEIRLLNEAPDETRINNRQTSLLTGLAESTLEQWRCTRRVEIPYFKLGKSIRYRLGDVRRFMEQSRVDAVGGGANE